MFGSWRPTGTGLFRRGSPEHHDHPSPCTPWAVAATAADSFKEDTMKKIVVRKTGSIRLTAPCQTHYNIFAF